MKSIKPKLAAIGLAAMAYFAPSPSQGELIQLISTDYVSSNAGFLEGAAQTSDSKLGLGEGLIRTYSDDLSSSSDLTTAVGGIDDAGSWDDNYVIVHNGGSGIDKVDISTGFSVGGSSVNGTGVEGISSVFTYNNAIHFAAIDSQDDTVKFFEWGNSTPVAIGPYVGGNYTGLEVIADGPVTDLSKLPVLVSRNQESGAKLDQYFSGALVQSYDTDTYDVISDISYNVDTGVLTASLMSGRAGGGMANFDFADQVVPEPATIGLFGLGALGAYALRRKGQ